MPQHRHIASTASADVSHSCRWESCKKWLDDAGSVIWTDAAQMLHKQIVYLKTQVPDLGPYSAR